MPGQEWLHRWAKGEGCSGCSGCFVVEEMEHVLSGLLKVCSRGEFGKGDFFGEEIDSKYITLLHGVWKVTLVTSVMFRGGADVPTNFAVLAKGGTRLGGHMGHNLGAGRSKRNAIEIVIPKKRCMGR